MALPIDAVRSGDVPGGRAPGWMPRLIAIDVDGTLLTSDHRLTPATVAQVARTLARGVEVLLASSRGPCALLPVLRGLALPDRSAFVASQGGFTGRYSRQGELDVLDQRPMPVALVRPVVAAARAAGIAVSWYAADLWLVSEVDRTIAREADIVGADPQVRDLAAELHGPEKVMLIAPTADLAPLRAIAAALPHGLRAQVSNPTYLEITRDDVDKAQAVAGYCAERGIGRQDVVAIGDGPNDLGMLDFAGVPVAPASARPEVLAAAAYVTAGNDDDGVAHALRALVP